MPFETFWLSKVVKYGPLQHDYEEARLLIGPIICEPPPLEQFQEFSVEYRLNAIEGSQKEAILCPKVNVIENGSDHANVNGTYQISKEKVQNYLITYVA